LSQVIIIGAGPAGACLSLILSQRDIPVTLIERRKNFDREFRGEILMPSGLEALSQLGIDKKLTQVSSYSPRHIQFFLNKKQILEISLKDAFGEKSPKAISQVDLLETLVGECQQYSCFKFYRGASVKSLIKKDNRVRGAHVFLDGGEKKEIYADLVIGADGRNSIVRKQCDLNAYEYNTPMDIVWCKLLKPEDWHGASFYAGQGNLLVAYQTWDDHLQMAWVILKNQFKDLREQGIDAWVELMADHVDPVFGQHLRQNKSFISNQFFLNSVSDCVEKWSVPGAMVIGDAAHTMSPVGGQGLNIAMRDAIVSANYLAPVFKKDTLNLKDLDEAIMQIEVDRMKEVKPIQYKQSIPPKIMLNQSLLGSLARRAIALLIKLPFVARVVGKNNNDFFYGKTKIELTV
jgi:2-polyprenyl-6-methoxyphenol hydroxylase-like FAD-dependent oxidoreductase